MKTKIAWVFNEFDVPEHFISYNKYGSGHINDTYIIETEGEIKFILQRINKEIFPDISGLMNNISIVLDHFSKNRMNNNGYEILTLIRTKENRSYLSDSDHNSWRCYRYIDDSRCFNKIDNPHLAFEAGCSYGHFQKMLTGLNPEMLMETIPHFHNLKMRIEAFDEALAHADAERIVKAGVEIETVNSGRDEYLKFNDLLLNGGFPKRICHNDTKINNILFNKELHAKCVVDLDTVMPGSILYDFGDAIRTGANYYDEDDDNPGIEMIDLSLFEAFTKGYLGMTKSFLTENEISHMAYSVQFMTFIIGLRFLTDYLSGDLYFKTSKPEHNLIRTKVQFGFLKDAVKKNDEMALIVKKLAIC